MGVAQCYLCYNACFCSILAVCSVYSTSASIRSLCRPTGWNSINEESKVILSSQKFLIQRPFFSPDQKPVFNPRSLFTDSLRPAIWKYYGSPVICTLVYHGLSAGICCSSRLLRVPRLLVLFLFFCEGLRKHQSYFSTKRYSKGCRIRMRHSHSRLCNSFSCKGKFFFFENSNGLVRPTLVYCECGL